MALHVLLILKTAGVAALCLLIIKLVWDLFVKPLVSPLRKIPGLPFKPLIGNIREATQKDYEAGDFCKRLAREYGPVCRFYHVLGRPFILVTSPELLHQVLVTECHKYSRPSGIRISPTGILNVSGREHASQRHLLAPLFTSMAVNDMLHVMEGRVAELCDYWDEALADKDVIPVQEDIRRMALDIVGRAVFGYDFDFLRQPDDERALAMSNLLAGFRVSNLAQFLPFYRYLPTEARRLEVKAIATCHALIDEMVASKKVSLQDYAPDEDRRLDLLDRLMLARDSESGEPLAEAHLKDQVIGFLLAGHETSAYSTTLVLWQLAQHPDVQERARAEVREVLPPRGRDLTHDTLDNLPYLTAVIRETLRLHPVLNATGRNTKVDVRLGGYDVPAGTRLHLHFGAMMRDPKLWPDPDTFLPDRFLAPEKIQPHSWMPFGGGPHMCLGMRLALQEMQVVLARLLQRYSFSPAPDFRLRLKMAVTVRPSPSVLLRVRRLGAEE